MDAHPDAATLDPAELRAVFAHLGDELDRPLDALRAGFGRLLDDPDRPPADDRRSQVRTMALVCDDLRALVRDYLDYAGLARGIRPLRLGSYRLGVLIDEVDRRFAARAEALGIAWRCAVEGGDEVVATDAARVRQLVGHLVENALRYTPEGGRVGVEARHEGAWWSVAVVDDGPGIPAEAMGRVFEPFFRRGRDAHTGLEGSGVGLAICREVARHLGGEIALGPAPDGGTRAAVRLPAATT